jgi:hypothetical protein
MAHSNDRRESQLMYPLSTKESEDADGIHMTSGVAAKEFTSRRPCSPKRFQLDALLAGMRYVGAEQREYSATSLPAGGPDNAPSMNAEPYWNYVCITVLPGFGKP